jgi:hypothetical protein
MPAPPLVEGPRWYRSRIRNLGPFAALLVPAAMGVTALFLLNVLDSSWSGMAGLVLGVFAAPGLLAVGAPFSDTSRYPLGIGLSVALWLVIGLVASRRSTRNPFAVWADYWRNYAWMAVGVFVGASAALAIARVSLGRALI